MTRRWPPSRNCCRWLLRKLWSAPECISSPACIRQIERTSLAFNTPEERYDYAVSQLNQGYFEEAREQFNGVIVDNPQADYAFYGLAVLDSITGHPQDCLDNLARAIELNPKNRLQARSDNDFQSMVDDPRFTELALSRSPVGRRTATQSRTVLVLSWNQSVRWTCRFPEPLLS